MTDFRTQLVEIQTQHFTREFSPLAVGPLRFWIQAGPEFTSTPADSGALEDVTSWEVAILDGESRSLGPGDLPALFTRMPWTRHWRSHLLQDGRQLHTGEYVPTARVQQLLESAELEFMQRQAEQDAALRRLAAEQEDEQRQLELEWEVDERLGFRRDYF